MANIAYVNGRYCDLADAAVHIEDRGYQFADGIYEYFAFYHHRILDKQLHLARLERSLAMMSITPPMSMRALQFVMQEVIARNGREHGGMYLQITRGVSRRDHGFPKQAITPSLVITICAAKFPKPHEVKDGVKVISHADQRWARRDIKSVSLLANIIAKQEAVSRQAREAWLVEENGVVTEGSASNSYIINAAGELITHPADAHILGGVSRQVVLALAKDAGVSVAERPFSIDEARQAREAFMTSTSINVLPVVMLDGKAIGDGKPGPITLKLQEQYNAHVYRQTGFHS